MSILFLSVLFCHMSLHVAGLNSDKVIETAIGRHHVGRRSLKQLCHQIDQTVGPSCLEYIGYGCYCGLGGHGTPVDKVDSCCQIHDQCYGNVKCRSSWYAYLTQYNVHCYLGHCHCSDSESSDPCFYTSCQCDRQLAECLKIAPGMNPKYKYYDRRKC
ncbi:hypothetical protein Btru_037269 [Bulinus truncatus]|nr:hypothetical protein Btru_037269 [Bulinus truncatus]